MGGGASTREGKRHGYSVFVRIGSAYRLDASEDDEGHIVRDIFKISVNGHSYAEFAYWQVDKVADQAWAFLQLNGD